MDSTASSSALSAINPCQTLSCRKIRKIIEDKELKKKLKKIPDKDVNGDPIYKIDIGKPDKKGKKKAGKDSQ
jgi:hypothetical protein